MISGWMVMEEKEDGGKVQMAINVNVRVRQVCVCFRLLCVDYS